MKRFLRGIYIERHFVVLVLIGLVGALSACTRPERHQSQLTISVPSTMKLQSKSQNALSNTGILAVVVLNVRGAGITTPLSIERNLLEEGKPQNSVPVSLPSTYSLTVPVGRDRLLQALAVYVDPTREGKQADFYYGEITRDLTGGDVNVDLALSRFDSGSLDAGKIAGRFIAADGTNPTGPLELRVFPTGASNPMVVLRRTMLSGWFSTIVLEKLPFDLVLAKTETPVLTKFDLSSFIYNSPSLMKVKLPTRTYVYQNGGGGSSSQEQRAPTSTIFGYFGPGVDPKTHRVCYTTGTNIFTNIKNSAGAPLNWNADIKTDSNNITHEGDNSITLCDSKNDAANYFSTVYPFNPSIMDNWGGDDAIAGFSGVFRFPLPSDTLQNSSAPARVSFDKTQNVMTASFAILPGIPEVVNEIGIFYRADGSIKDYEGPENVRCGDIAKGGLGFVKVGGILLEKGKTDYPNQSLGQPPPDITNSSVVAFCPLRDGFAMGGGFANNHPYDAANQGQNNPSNPPKTPNSFRLETPFQSLGTNQCLPLRLFLVYEDGNIWNGYVRNDVGYSFSLELSQNNGAVTNLFNSETECKANGTPLPVPVTVTLPKPETQRELWMKTSSIYPNSNTIVVGTNVATNSTPLLATPTPMASTNPLAVQSPLPTPYLLKAVPDRLQIGANGDCRMLDVYFTDRNGTPVAISSGTLTLANINATTLAADGDASLRIVSNCSDPNATAIPSISPSGSQYKTSIGIRSILTTPPQNRVIKITGDSQFIHPTASAVNTASNLDVLKLAIGNNGDTQPPIFYGSCFPISASAFDNGGTHFSPSLSFYLAARNQTTNNLAGLFVNSCDQQGINTFAVNDKIFAMSNGVLQTPTPHYWAVTDPISAGSLNNIELTTYTPLQNREAHLNFSVLPVPAATRVPTHKVHLTSDVLQPNKSPLPVADWPKPMFPQNAAYLDNGLLPLIGFDHVEPGNAGLSPSTDGNPGLTGVYLSGTTKLVGIFRQAIQSPTPTFTPIPILSNYDVAVTTRFMLTQLQDDATIVRLRSPESDQYIQVTAGFNHTCALNGKTRKIDCWGSNSLGQLGNLPTGTVLPIPTPIADATTYYSSVASGFDEGTCGIVMPTPTPMPGPGLIKCWGSNSSGQLGVGYSSVTPITTPTSVVPAENFRQVSIGKGFKCAITETGTLKCWGSNNYPNGTLGIGIPSITGVPTPTPASVGSIKFSKVALGQMHGCALQETTGTPWCWGSNSIGQVGDPMITALPSPTQLPVANFGTFTDLALGEKHTCGIVMPTPTPTPGPGPIRCWGDNSVGQLGVATPTQTPMPVTISTLNFRKIAAGANHTCAITAVDELYCWGSNSKGQITGSPTPTPTVVPTPLKILGLFKDIALGAQHTCALTVANELRCWGDNAQGQIGNGMTYQNPAPPTTVGNYDLRLQVKRDSTNNFHLWINDKIDLTPNNNQYSAYLLTNQWYTVTLARQISLSYQLVGRITSGTLSYSPSSPLGWSPSNAEYTTFEMGPLGAGGSGQVRALLIDYGTFDPTSWWSNFPTGPIEKDHDYLKQRLPDQ